MNVWVNEAPSEIATAGVNAESVPVPPDMPSHAAGVQRATVWSAPDGFVNVTDAPAGIVTAAGEKQ